MGTNIFLTRLQRLSKAIDSSHWTKACKIEDKVFYGVFRDETRLYTRLTRDEAARKLEGDQKLHAKQEKQ